MAREAKANATPALAISPATSKGAESTKVDSTQREQMRTGVPAVGLSSQTQDSVAAAQPKEPASRETQVDPEKQVKTLVAALDTRLNQNQAVIERNLKELTNPSNPADDLAAQQAARHGNSKLAVGANPKQTEVETGSALRDRASLLERKQKAERLLREGKTEQALSYLQSSPTEQSRNIDTGHTDRAVSAHRDAAAALEAGNLEKAKLLEDLAQRAEYDNSTNIGASNYAAQRLRKELLSAAIGDASRATNSESIAQVRKDYDSTLDSLDAALASKDTGKIKETLTSLKEQGRLTELDRLDAALERRDIGKIKDVVASLKQQGLLPKSGDLDAALASKDIEKIKETLTTLRKEGRLPHTIISQISSDWRQNINRTSPTGELVETDLDPGPGPNPFSMGQKRNERIGNALDKTEDMQSLPDATRALMVTRDNPKEPLSPKDKETYLLAVEAQKSGHHKLAQSMVTSLATGNTDTARKLYLDNLASLSPEQRFASAQTVQTAKVMENARSIEAAHKKIHGGDSTMIKEGREDLQLGLDERKDLLLLQVEANELAQAGRLEKAEALLSGKTSLDGLDAEKLKASNPNAPRLTGENRKELSNETVVTQQREQLQQLINGNRSAMAQLEAQKQTLDKAIQEREQASLGKSQGLMEKRTLLAVQQEKLARETQRLFQTHDKATSFINKGDLGAARDLIEGRKAVLDKNETVETKQDAKLLAGREFVRNAAEEIKYKKTDAALKSLEEQQTKFGMLKGGVRTNLSLTKADIKKSNWIADWGGHTAGLEKTALKEQARLGSFEQQKTKVAEAKSTADTLVKQGRYEEATALLGKAQALASKEFIKSNEELQKAYGEINKDLDKFYQNFKDSSLTVVKNVAIGVVAASVAIALAPATGGMSLAVAGTMIGGGTLAGFALGTAIDVVDAGVDMAVFKDSAKTAFGDALGKAGSNLQTAGLGALGGGSGAVFTKLLAAKGVGALTSALSSAGGSSALSSGTTALIERTKAEIAYAKLPEAEKANKTKEEFMKERKLDAASITKSLTIETLSGMGGGALGFKSAKAQVGATAARQAVIETTEKAVDMLIGLATEAALNDGNISPDGLAGALGNVAVGGVIGKHTAAQFEARRMAATADSSVVVAADAEPSNTAARVDDVPEQGRLDVDPDTRSIGEATGRGTIPLPSDIAALPQLTRLQSQGAVTASINPDLPAGVNARTTVEIDPVTGKRNVRFEYANDDIAHGDSPASRKIRLEEATHALEPTIVDPIKPDGTKMSEQEYTARRVAQELLVRAGAEGKLSGSSSNPEQRKNSELYKEAKRLIDAGDYEAAKALGDGFNQSDWNNFKDNFGTNVNRDPSKDPLRQVSNSADPTVPDKSSLERKLIEDNLGELPKTLEEVKDYRESLDLIADQYTKARVSDALDILEQNIVLDALQGNIDKLKEHPGLINDATWKAKTVELLKHKQNDLKESISVLQEAVRLAKQSPSVESAEALNTTIKHLSEQEKLITQIDATRKQLEDLIKVEKLQIDNESRAPSDPTKKKDELQLATTRKEILGREIPEAENSEAVQKLQKDIGALVNKYGSHEQRLQDLSKMDPALRQNAYELSKVTEATASREDIAKVHKLAVFMKSIENLPGGQDFIDNLNKLKEKGHEYGSSIKDALEKYENARKTSTGKQLEATMTGPFSELQARVSILNNPLITNPVFGTRSINSTEIIDSNGNQMVAGRDFSLTAPSGGKSEISHNGTKITVNNGTGKQETLIYDANTGKFMAGGKEATVIYDDKTGKFVAREFDAVYKDPINGATVTDIKADTGTARNSESAKAKDTSPDEAESQFRARLALAKRLGMEPAYTIGKPMAEISNSKSTSSPNPNDTAFYRDKIAQAHALGLTLRIYDVNQVEITHLF